ncbi:ATP-grasp domain-containing protein [Devosia sp.]|uniref:carboxylate--amine ligase n=1 Tax=Devosia sp. TaxID=1871048 RepID=UPI0026047714|nr:ATP-grasp domain-containing protein [Devosia sp.]
MTDPQIAGAIILGGSYGSLAVARSFGRQGIRVSYFSAVRSVAQYCRYVTHHVPWQGPGDLKALDALFAAADRLGMNGWLLLPSGDAEVQFVARNFDALSERFVLVTQDWAALEPLNNKAQLYRLADTLGIDYPRVHVDEVVDRPASEIRFPVVIKPSSTEKSNPLTKAKAWKAESAAEYVEKYALATQYMGKGGFVVQELIPGDGESQFSYAGLWNHGVEVCGLTARRSRQFPAEFGTSPFVETSEQPRVLAEAQALLKAVHYHGLVEVEFKLDARDDRLKLLDVNTRIWAWIGLGAAAGLDFPVLAAAVATATLPTDVKASYGASWVRAVPNALSLLQSLQRTGNLGYAAGRSLSPFAGPAIFAFDDPVPALLELPIQVMRRL